MFLPWAELERRFTKALREIGDANPARLTELRASSLFFFLHSLYETQCDANGKRQPIVVVTETNNRAERMRQFLYTVERLVADREPHPSDYQVYPDFEPQNLFEYCDPPVETIDARNNVLDGLLEGSVKVVFTSYKACWRKLPSPDDYRKRKLVFAVSGGAQIPAGAVTRIERDELAARLDSIGYRPVTMVTGVGEYAVRGGLVDVYAVGEEQPVRIDLFGEEIEQLQRFDPATQRTNEGALTQLSILPFSAHTAHLAHPAIQDWLRERWESYANDMRDVLPRSSFDRLDEVVQTDLELMASGASTPRGGWYYRATCSDDACLWHYLHEDTRVVVHEEGFVESETTSYFRFWEQRFSDWLKNGLSFLDMDAVYFTPPKSLPELPRQLIVADNGFAEIEVPPRLLFTHSFGGADDDLPQASIGLDSPVAGKWGTTKIATTIGKIQRVKPQDMALNVPPRDVRVDRPASVLSQFSARLREVLHDEGVHPEVENAILPGGFVIPAASAGPRDTMSPFPEAWTVITDVEIFGEIAEVTQAPARRYRKDALKQTDELNPGDFVVHIDYGIGRFAQLTERNTGGITKSYVEVEFAGRDRLFVPVEQLDRLRRYSYDGSEPRLNSLGKDQWKKTKEKVRVDTVELAKRLLSLYKARRTRAGFSYSGRTVWEDEFAEGFPYNMTEDQLVAWRDVERDMEAAKPMDRLLCGDVGFGKTEIALRAAFKACVDEHQVLVLCPTTILADQHYHTFNRRFKPFPLRVAQLSRFQSKAEQKDIITKLHEGRIDVVIATHRALSKDVGFKRLGLLVVDEEQRFGVKQKEKMKMRWTDVDVLSMSATPIPRTLHMSLVGLRDISLIETAPIARKPVKTYVGEHDHIMVREAILRELGRGGQVYYLHNRVQDIERVRQELEQMIDDEKVVVAHGQMREDQLEEVMRAFSLGAYKIMLATTIIENGLDIPSVNTIILTHAENLGLSQMHQLRGRVGRSAVQAYAYFFHQPNRVLTEESQNRLHAIYNYAYLGAGYEIAQSDLRIRGAGNLLGEAQSGLAKAVGFEYYCELLARSINDVKALDEADIEEWEDTPLVGERLGAQVDLPLPCFIPDEYISDPVLRLDILRDLAALSDEASMTDFSAELADRFGEPPAEVCNLLMVVRIRNLAAGLGIQRVNYNRGRQSFELRLYDGEGDWYRRAPLVDSRFSASPQDGMLLLAMDFEIQKSADELYDAITGLNALK